MAKVSGMPYERYGREHVFAPAGMKTAGFVAYGNPTSRSCSRSAVPPLVGSRAY